MSDTIIIRRNGEKFAVDCSTVLEAFNGHLKVKFLGTICPHCGSSDTCWIPVRKVEDDGDRTVKLYEVDFKDGYSMVIMGRRKPTIDEANAFLYEDINRMKGGSVVNVTNEISEEDARKFYDFTNHKNWVIFPREGAK